ncbi:TPA: hypothetical protein DEP21_00405 [Patescibacteria group bacterium]|nr:hypothetical protein [Candidatus Gracilibacteria bacterium]
MERFKTFVFSKITTIFLILIFLLINTTAFFAEYLFGEIDFDTEKWVRLLSILFDFIVIGLGILAWFQIHFRKSFVKLSMYLPFKDLFWIKILADTFAVFCVVYLLYVLRLLFFLWYGRITEESLLYNSLLGLIGVILFGFINYLVRRIKKSLRRYLRR